MAFYSHNAMRKRIIAVAVYLSVTRWYCIKTDKDIIKLFSWPCIPTTIVF